MATNPSKDPGSALPKSSTLNSHLNIQGDVRFSGDLIVDCKVSGSITTEDNLTIGVRGKVEAEVTAGTVEIAGKMKGNIKAKKSVKILKGGEVQGNIETPSISMESGVVFEGNCTRPGVTHQLGREASRASAPQRTAAAPAMPVQRPVQTTTPTSA